VSESGTVGGNCRAATAAAAVRLDLNEAPRQPATAFRARLLAPAQFAVPAKRLRELAGGKER
jgi:hypothetical protein